MHAPFGPDHQRSNALCRRIVVGHLRIRAFGEPGEPAQVAEERGNLSAMLSSCFSDPDATSSNDTPAGAPTRRRREFSERLVGAGPVPRFYKGIDRNTLAVPRLE